MTTLAELVAVLQPDALPPVGADVGVGWVRVLRARVPALDVLEAGDLVIVPAASLDVVAPTPSDVRELAHTLARSRASGLLLVPPPAGQPHGLPSALGGPGGPGVPGGSGGPAVRDPLADLAAAAADAELPAVRVEGVDAPALERRLIGYLVDRRGELDRQAAELEADLARIALAGQGLEALAAAIGRFLRRAVALEGRRGDTLVLHAPVDVADAAAAAAAYLARPHATGRRVALPGPPGEPGPAGWLVLLGDRPATDLEPVATERIAPLVALQLALDVQVRRARDEAGRAEPLPSDGPPWVVLVARQPEPGPGEPTREEVRQELRFRFAARRLALRGTSQSLELRAIAALERDDPRGLRVADRIARFLGRPVGLSAPFAEPAGRPAGEAAARGALEAAERLTEPPLVARADRVPAYRLLATVGSLPEDRAQAAALLEPLLVGRPAAVRERLATLRAVLDHPGAGEAAAVLGIHRNTLAYRMRVMEQRTGWSLADPELRLALLLAVRTVQQAQ